MPTDVLVVGGGVIGLSAAWRMAERGASVTVVDPSPGRGASWVAGGMLAPVSETGFGETDLTRLLVAGAALWPSFARELEEAAGRDPGFRAGGTVVVAADASDRAVVDDLLRFQLELGLEATRLSASGCRALVPALSPAVRGGAHVPGDHRVDNRALVEALLAAGAAAGVLLVRREVAGIVVDGRGRVAGVTLEDGEPLPGGSVLVAAGAATGGLDGVPAGTLPAVRPVKGHVLRLGSAGGPPLLPCTVRGLVRGRPCYLVPRDDGSVVVGATSEERGFDTAVQAGAVHGLLDDARALVPGVDELELLECRAGLRPGSPDNAPVIGWTGVPGLAVASGHYRNGILLAPITATAVADLLDGGAPPEPVGAFGPARFATPAGAPASVTRPEGA